MLQVQITQIALTETSSEHKSDAQALGQRIHAQLYFRLAAVPESERIFEQTACFIQLLAVEPSTGRTIVLAAERRQLFPDRHEYMISMICDLPEIGRYQLLGMVLLPEVGVVEVAFGPAFRVMP